MSIVSLFVSISYFAQLVKGHYYGYELPSYITIIVYSFLYFVILIISGIGLRKTKRWAVYTFFIFSIINILSALVNIAIQKSPACFIGVPVILFITALWLFIYRKEFN